jgi:Rap1a immunity proteins
MKRLLLALSLTVATAAHAGFTTGDDLLKACTAQGAEAALQVYCHGYLAGVSDFLDATRHTTGVGEECVPLGTALEQLQEVVVNLPSAAPRASGCVRTAAGSPRPWPKVVPVEARSPMTTLLDRLTVEWACEMQTPANRHDSCR